MSLSEQYQPALRFGFNQYNFAIKVCGIGNTQIAPLTTVSGSGTTSLQGLINALAPLNYVDACRQAANAMVSLKDLGVISDTTVGTADTVSALRNILIAADTSSTLAGTAYTTFAFPI
jgi:hypothetical protein